jgi:hypothetical protein
MFPAVKRLVPFLIVLCAALALAGSASADFSFQTTSLELPAGDRVESVAVGDVDGHDGPDLVIAYGAGSGGGIAVELNDGHGHFGAPQTYSAAGAGCEFVSQVELADIGGPPSSIQPDGRLDAVIACVEGGGEHIYLARMFGDGNGGFSAPVVFGESDYGSFNGLALSHQSFALVDYSGRPQRSARAGLDLHVPALVLPLRTALLPQLRLEQ